MKFLNKKFVGPVIGIIFIFLIVKNIDLNKSFEALKHLNIFYLVLIVPVYYSSFLFRALRWRVLVTEDKKIKLTSFLDSLFRGWFMNCIIPARGGEIYRAHYLGKKENISRIKIMASVVLERVFDGLILFLILLFLVSFVYSSKKFFGIAIAAGTLFSGGYIFLLLTSKFYKNPFFQKRIYCFLNSAPKFLNKILNKITSLAASFINGLNMLNSPILILKTFLFTILVWFFEGLTSFLLIKGFGYSIGMLGALFVQSVIAFISLIPGGPASLGPLQWGYIVALGFFKIPKETAFAMSIACQLFVLISVSFGCLFFMLAESFNLKEENSSISLEN